MEAKLSVTWGKFSTIFPRESPVIQLFENPRKYFGSNVNFRFAWSRYENMKQNKESWFDTTPNS